MTRVLSDAAELIGWTSARLAANCARNTEDIEHLMKDGVDVAAGSLPVRVLEQRGCRFEVDGSGNISSVTGPLDVSRLQEIKIDAKDSKAMEGLSLGPVTSKIKELHIHVFNHLRRNGLVDLGTVQEVITFDGVRETRHSDRIAVRLSKKGWHYLRMLEAKEVERADREAQAGRGNDKPD